VNGIATDTIASGTASTSIRGVSNNPHLLRQHAPQQLSQPAIQLDGHSEGGRGGGRDGGAVGGGHVENGYEVPVMLNGGDRTGENGYEIPAALRGGASASAGDNGYEIPVTLGGRAGGGGGGMARDAGATPPEPAMPRPGRPRGARVAQVSASGEHYARLSPRPQRAALRDVNNQQPRPPTQLGRQRQNQDALYETPAPM